MVPSSTAASSANAPVEPKPTTRSPGENSEPSGASRTTPANSLPSTKGRSGLYWYRSRLSSRSGKLIPAALTSTSTSRSPRTGSATSPTSSASGPSVRVTCTARTRSLLSSASAATAPHRPRPRPAGVGIRPASGGQVRAKRSESAPRQGVPRPARQERTMAPQTYPAPSPGQPANPYGAPAGPYGAPGSPYGPPPAGFGYPQQPPQPKKNTGKIVGGIVGALVLVAGAVVGALLLFGTKTLDDAKLTDLIATATTNAGAEASDISCPGDVEVQKGNTFTCTATVDGQQVTYQVTQTDDE